MTGSKTSDRHAVGSGLLASGRSLPVRLRETKQACAVASVHLGMCDWWPRGGRSAGSTPAATCELSLVSRLHTELLTLSRNSPTNSGKTLTLGHSGWLIGATSLPQEPRRPGQSAPLTDTCRYQAPWHQHVRAGPRTQPARPSFCQVSQTSGHIRMTQRASSHRSLGPTASF